MKTLVIIDTNKLRSTKLGETSYGSFDLGLEFNSLNSFIKKNELSTHIKIAIPEIAKQELLQQKSEQYSKDIQTISRIQGRLSQVPGADFSRIALPPEAFDCKEHLKPRIEDYVRNNDLAIIDMEEGSFGSILKEVLRRAIERRPPFKKSKNYTDIGFKDVMIWESILRYGSFDNYDKIILLTNDLGFDEACRREFESKIHKRLEIISSVQFLLTEIEEDFGPEIRRNKWRDYAKQDYFRNYLEREVSSLENVDVDGSDHKVIRATIDNYLDDVEEPGEDETTDFATILVASVKATIEIDGTPKEVTIKARIFLDDAKDIQGTEYNVEEA